MRLEKSDGRWWVWYRKLDNRDGYWAFGPVGTTFKRRKPLHWYIALLIQWREGRQR